jgi:hypothetical protein
MVMKALFGSEYRVANTKTGSAGPFYRNLRGLHRNPQKASLGMQMTLAGIGSLW